MQKSFIIKCDNFSSAYDICSILDTYEDVVYSVYERWIHVNYGQDYIEYQIKYSYVIEGVE